MNSTNLDPTTLSGEDLREAVRDRYAASARAVAEKADGTGTCCDSSCCGENTSGTDPVTRDLYDAEAAAVSEDALMASLGCGNPTMLAALEQGQTVLDLGSGGGLDVLLSARRVGPTGTAYGVDMTDEMLDLARRNQRESGIDNAEFLKGTIEQVPLPDNTVDVVISNCVINLAGDKDLVLREAFRVVKPGGRLAVSDIVLLRELPVEAQQAMSLWTGCVGGALLSGDYMAKLLRSGFTDISVEVTRIYTRQDLVEMADSLPSAEIPEGLDVSGVVDALDGAVVSAFVRARKPVGL